MSSLSLGSAFVDLAVKGQPQFDAAMKSAQGQIAATGKAGDTLGTKFKAGLAAASTAATKLVGDLRQIGERAQIVFAAGTAAIAGFVQAASPDAMKTLTGSFQLLAAEIGRAFVPYVNQASKAVQDAAKWFRELDPAVKDSYARIALWTVGAAGTLVVVGKLTTAFTALAGAINLAGGALAVVGLPLAALLAGGFKFSGALGDLESRGRLGKLRPEERFTRTEFEASDVYKRQAAIADPAKRRLTADLALASATAEAEEARRAAAEYTGPLGVAGAVFGVGGARAAFDRQAQADRNLQLARAARQEARGKPFAGKPGDEFMQSLTMRPAQYLDLAAVREQAQIAALGGDPLERARQQIQEEIRDANVRTAAAVENLAQRPGPVA